MKTENERLKDIFAKNFGQRTDTPDFEFMWHRAGEGNRKKRLSAWRIAASVALLVTVGTMAILHRQESRKDSRMQITSWTEPTRMLVPSRGDVPLNALTHWTSPTRSLLSGNDHLTK